MFRILLSVCLVLTWATVARPQSSTEEDTRLRDAILPLIAEHRGEVAVAIEHLVSNEAFKYREDAAMPTASLIKFPLMITVYQHAARGELDLSKSIALKETDKVPGSGILTEHFSEGATLPLRDYVRLMIRDSDNTATNVVIDQIGLAATAQSMESLGLENTKLHSKVYRGDTSIFPERSKQFGIGSTTANEMVTLLRMLQDHRLGDAASTELMMNHLAACDDRSKLARYLKPGTRIFHKTGAIGNCRTDAGIIETGTGPVAVCVLTNKNDDQSWSDSNAAELLCAKIGKNIVERFGQEEPPATLQRGSTGLLVEALQRTLNARLKDPSANLSVDGDFGPATESAVKRFQQEHGIDPTGQLDPGTWQALGTLVEETELSEEPEQFNAREAVRERQPAPASSDPPAVTCKSWVVADAATGVELSGWNASERRPPASTTKLMTALLIVELMAEDPHVAAEIVTFSKNADETIGSSSGLRAGERIAVSELLYGLMLPSGNDASIALAEHFGGRFQHEPSAIAEGPVAAFVAKMNTRAKELGMNSTHFENPHGLSESEHLTTASDLARLAFVAAQSGLLRQLVSTRQHATTVDSEQGYRRTVLWRNTNQLLDIEGYAGMKTGTTEAAGARLVTLGSRDGKSRIVVVLGASDSQSRYSDTRNLFRWSQQSH